jgi:hypothetical protein
MCDGSPPTRAPSTRIVRCSKRPRPSSCGRRIGDPRLCRSFAAGSPWCALLYECVWFNIGRWRPSPSARASARPE